MRRYLERVTIQRKEHVGIVVDDLAAATASLVGEVELDEDSYRLC